MPMKVKFSTRNLINIMYTNADTLTNKLNELSMMADNYELVVIMITEVKLKYSMESTSVARINIDGYHVYTNLASEAHPGVAIHNANSIGHQSTEVRMNTLYEESVLVSIDLKGHDKLLAGCVY